MRRRSRDRSVAVLEPEHAGGALRGLSLGTLEEGPDLSPERLPHCSLGLWELGKGGFVAESGEVGVLSPVLHHPLHRGAVGGLVAFQLLGPGEVGVLSPVIHYALHPGAVVGLVGFRVLGPEDQVAAHPVEGPLPQAGSFLVVEFGCVLALAGGGQRGGRGLS
jgi:hypothetical protein